MSEEPKNTVVSVRLDPKDYAAVQAAMARRQLLGRYLGCIGSVLPDGDSDLAGALLAEICRGWIEMLDLIRGEDEK